MRLTGSLRTRLVLVAAAAIALGLAAVAMGVQALLAGHLARGFDARLESVAVAVIAAVESEEDGSALALARPVADSRFDAALSGWYWQIVDAEGTLLLRSRSLWDGAIVDADARGRALRRIAVPFTLPESGEPLTVAVAGPQEALEDELSSLRQPLLLVLALFGVCLVVLAAALTTAALSPIARLRQGLEAVRCGAATRLAPPRTAELAPFADELNALLDHTEAVLARARGAAADLAHALKTPLAALTNHPDRDGVIAPHVARMQRLIARHLGRARAGGSTLAARAPVRDVLTELIGAMERIHAGIAFTITAEDVTVAIERTDLEEMLGNLLDNAGKYARTTVHVTVMRAGRRVRITIEDDGPGLADPEAALARGARLDETGEGSGLGLAIVRDLAALYDVELSLIRASSGGLAAVLTLPAV